MKNLAQKKQFSDSFIWGVATSAFQIEGASQTDGKGLSIWDTFCQQPNVISDNSNGDIACDHYNRLESDLDLIQSLGVNAYRFSVSWPRVQPIGKGPWNEKGFEFYDRLIDGLLERNIAPHLTLYHWDLPQRLQIKGGWENRSTIDYFSEYATEVTQRFGDRIASICTFNEPWVVAILGYEHGIFAPGIKSRKVAMQVSHHLLVAHGQAIQAMNAINPDLKKGIVLNLSPLYPASDNPEDVAKCRIDDGLTLRWYMDSLFLGSYPNDVIDFIGNDAPIVKNGDMKTIKQNIDFLGVNYYTRNFSSHNDSWDVARTGNDVTCMGWEIYPQGLTELLLRLHNDYPVPQILITENGAAFKDILEKGVVADDQRIKYINDHILATKEAIDKGVDVGGYFAWSLMDNFEWASGYEKRFGMVYVDYQTQKRYLKDSAQWYKRLLEKEG